MKICVIGDLTTTTGFRLAGVSESYEVTEPKEALLKLEGLVKDEDVGLIIITENIGDSLREEINTLTEGKITPLIVEIPDKKGPLEERRDPIRELIKKAVGVEIKY